MGRDSSTSLAPGFRFHPTDEELVRYYLKRKVCGKPLRVDPITVVDIYKSEPWELPEKSKLRTRDLEWYFFSALDKKYGNGSRTNRATQQGYWKTTGKDRPIRHCSRTVGMKKTLVYHSGRAPKGARSNWVMHEYRLEDEELVKAGIAQDAFVLCRIFEKSGSGPKNGEQYGAPFIEEEWDDDVMAVVPGDEVPVEEVPYGEGLVEDAIAFADVNELEQNFGTSIPSAVALQPEFYNVDTAIYVDHSGNFSEHVLPEIAPLPSNFYHGETSNYIEPSGDFSEGDMKPMIGGEASELGNEQRFFELPQEQYVIEAQPVKEDYFAQPSNEGNLMDANISFVDQFLDITDDAPFGEGLYLETNDLSDPIEKDSTDFDLLDEYLTYFDAEDGNIQFTAFDSSQTLGVENADTEQKPQKFVTGEADLVPVGTEQMVEAHDSNNNNAASSSNEKDEVTKSGSEFTHPFLKQASQMLSSIPAPPAFASEFPTKEAVLRLNSAAQASSSVHVTAGIIRIRNLNLEGNATDWSIGKNGDVNLLLSYYSPPQADICASAMVPVVGALSSKTGCVVTKGWFMFMFIWVLIMSVSFKVGSYIYTKS